MADCNEGTGVWGDFLGLVYALVLTNVRSLSLLGRICFKKKTPLHPRFFACYREDVGVVRYQEVLLMDCDGTLEL